MHLVTGLTAPVPSAPTLRVRVLMTAAACASHFGSTRVRVVTGEAVSMRRGSLHVHIGVTACADCAVRLGLVRLMTARALLMKRQRS